MKESSARMCTASARVLAVALAVLGCSLEPSSDDAGEASRSPVPDFALADLQGNEVRLSSLRGKTVVIDFWATWCAPCIFQIPELNAFYNAHRDDPGVAVLGVSVDFDGIEVVEPYAREQNIQYPVLLGSESLARKFGAPGFPWLLIVGPDGTHASDHVGFVERDELEKIVAAARDTGPA